jgi:hypothetical protein
MFDLMNVEEWREIGWGHLIFCGVWLEDDPQCYGRASRNLGQSHPKKIVDKLIPHHSHHSWCLMRIWSHQSSLQSNMKGDELIPHFHPSNQIADGMNLFLTLGMTLSHPSLTLIQMHHRGYNGKNQFSHLILYLADIIQI